MEVNKRYKALSIIENICYFLAVVTIFIGTPIGGTMIINSLDFYIDTVLLYIGISTIITCIGFVAFGNLLNLLISLEETNRQNAILLEKLARYQYMAVKLQNQQVNRTS